MEGGVRDWKTEAEEEIISTNQQHEGICQHPQIVMPGQVSEESEGAMSQPGGGGGQFAGIVYCGAVIG